ncbi:DNA-binding protein [Polynucleobacter sp. SHI8]|uniref:H-NS histone family protein n=1 Tax=unclassified Polynucleobacter TaxID=2640945 RepID=UPI002493AFB4|nr:MULTISPECIES: H-NS histone family protein [unclassified Polynucleobacter]BDW11551.1 DNA-binding protein [Polynucleobacter sp. SHI2]BDW13998.1 DNA-binding protein [Polynucleobacter sp. SHI8]
MSNYDELIEQRKLLDQQILAIQQKEKQEAIELIKIMIEKHSLSASDLFSKKVNQANKKVPAKYRNPATGETWTGRGKAPLWIVGKERETFIIRG